LAACANVVTPLANFQTPALSGVFFAALLRQNASSAGDKAKLRPARLSWATCSAGTEFFDPVSGDAKVFYVKIDGRFELFDRPGFIRRNENGKAR
jgi:hypothetical protein